MKLLSLVLVLVGMTVHQDGKKIKILQYEAFTRGSTYLITIDQDSIRVQEGLRGAPVKSRAITKAEWEELQLMSAKIDLAEIHSLEAPTSGRFSDAAAHAEVQVHAGARVYTSAGFDHETPPEALDPLVKAMITLAETVE